MQKPTIIFVHFDRMATTCKIFRDINSCCGVCVRVCVCVCGVCTCV